MEDFSLLYNINTNVSKFEGDKKKNRVTNFNISKSSMLLKSLSKFFDENDINSLKEKYKNIVGSLNNDYLAAAIYLVEKNKDESYLSIDINKCLIELGVPKNKRDGATITLISYYHKVLSLNED